MYGEAGEGSHARKTPMLKLSLATISILSNAVYQKVMSCFENTIPCFFPLYRPGFSELF